MKKVFLLFFIFLLLSSCAGTLNGDDFSQSSGSTSEQPVISTEPYSFSEVNTLFGPGPFSVNELVEIFGDPTFLDGYYGGYYNDKNDFFVISIVFTDVMFDLAANNGEKLNLIKDDSRLPYDNNYYKLTDSDREVRLKPQSMGVSGGDWILPRKMKFGDSIDVLYNVYDGNKGKEKYVEGRFMVSYDYGESGRITYEFHDTTYKLEQVTIEWYDALM